ncbi:hypothetical protein [Streptomyces sp. NPDC057199]|uniref:hypothetical protein n=1 Tax=Streptomyces sp. NPDC057199 TaxID=3346047 RepID=UPI0036363671
MRDGGSGSDGDVDGPDKETSVKGLDEETSVGPRGRFGSLTNRLSLRGQPRKRRWAVVGAAVVVLAAGVSLPLALADSGHDKPCWRLPAAKRALADDARAATRALDPGEDLERLGSVRKLLAHERVCDDGARVLGDIVNTATRSTGSGAPHTLAQARGAYAVAAVLHDVEIPDGLAPGVARMLAEYVVDAGRDGSLGDDDANRPAVPAEEAQLDPNGYSRYGRLLAAGEAHVVFEHSDSYADADANIEYLVAELAEDPEAFAILYDAERAYFAYYLERLTDSGGDPDFRPSTDKRFESTPQDWPDNDLQDMSGRIGNLMKYRAAYIRNGTIPDLAAFDKAVREHTRGTFRPASRQLEDRPPMGDIADRKAAGPVRGDLMDGRHQLFTVLEGWAEERNVSAERTAAMRQLVDDWYVRALWMTIY